MWQKKGKMWATNFYLNFFLQYWQNIIFLSEIQRPLPVNQRCQEASQLRVSASQGHLSAEGNTYQPRATPASQGQHLPAEGNTCQPRATPAKGASQPREPASWGQQPPRASASSGASYPSTLASQGSHLAENTSRPPSRSWF